MKKKIKNKKARIYRRFPSTTTNQLANKEIACSPYASSRVLGRFDGHLLLAQCRVSKIRRFNFSVINPFNINSPVFVNPSRKFPQQFLSESQNPRLLVSLDCLASAEGWWEWEFWTDNVRKSKVTSLGCRDVSDRWANSVRKPRCAQSTRSVGERRGRWVSCWVYTPSIPRGLPSIKQHKNPRGSAS